MGYINGLRKVYECNCVIAGKSKAFYKSEIWKGQSTDVYKKYKLI